MQLGTVECSECGALRRLEVQYELMILV